MRYLGPKFIFIFQLAIITLMIFGILPREFSFIITAILLVYIFATSIENALFLSIASIPFYIALPISDNFDSMANWRIIIAALFVKWTIANNPIIYRHSEPKAKNPPRMWDWRIRARFFGLHPQNDIIKNIKQFLFNPNTRLEVLGLIFLVVSLVSLIGASDMGVGIKKILFLVNIFLLYILVKNIANTYEKIISVAKAATVAIGFTLFIGYGQLLSVFFYSLYDFWQFWAGNVISVFYGGNLSQLLLVSNTWFSYFGNGTPPTLRMFSVFPDSHSFALFNIISIPFLLSLMLYYKEFRCIKIPLIQIRGFVQRFIQLPKSHYHLICILIVLSLLAIILSGSRGAWVSGMIPLILSILIIGTKKIKIVFRELPVLINQISNIKYQKYKLNIKNIFASESRLVLSTIILFFLLFPVSSIILDQSQRIELARLNNGGVVKDDGTTFKRFASVADVTETSNKGRLEIWKDTLNSIKKHPILGVGLGNFPVVLAQEISAGKKGASAHNLFLDIFAETGILGLVAFLLIFYTILKSTFYVFKNCQDPVFKIFAASFGIYLFWIFGYSLFDVVLFNDKVLMMFMVGVGVLYGIRNTLYLKSG